MFRNKFKKIASQYRTIKGFLLLIDLKVRLSIKNGRIPKQTITGQYL